MRTVKNVTVESPHGTVVVDVSVYGRKGFKAPNMYCFMYKGRLITPVEQRVKGWKMPFQSIFKVMHSDGVLEQLIYKPNPFLTIMEKSKSNSRGSK